MVGRYDLCHTIKCLLKLGTPHSKEVDKLLRIVAAAARPESSALTSREYHTIIIIRYFSYLESNILLVFKIHL